MEKLRKVLAIIAIVAGTIAALFGAFQTARVLWAMSRPPLGVFEPLVPLGAGVVALLMGLWLIKTGRALRPVVDNAAD